METLLYTGGTGFLGKNTRPILEKLYQVTTCGISNEDNIQSNLANEIPLLPQRFDIVLHACGKAHSVPRTDAEKQSFYDVNYQGTINLCQALERVGLPRAFIYISTMSVYGDIHGHLNDEDTPLKGDSPYAESKIMAEHFLKDWCAKNNVTLGILRPSLLAGRNAPGNLGMMVNGIKTGAYLSIAKGKARKSILMAEDIAHIVPKIADIGGVYNICDDYNPSFGELETIIAKQLGKRPPISIPLWFAKCLAKIGDFIPFCPINSNRLEKIITDDTWSNKKAKKALNWQPMDVLSNYKI